MNFSRLLALVLSVVLATQAWATDVGGPVISNTTWTLAGSPYVVTNAIIVGGNATLTIQPGVTVKFNAGLGITVGSQAWGIGTLKAIGTAGQKITFTSNTNPGQPGQWKDIFFTDRCIDAGFDGGGAYLSGSTLQHCLVEFAGGGAAGSGAVTISQSSPFINFCEVRNNARSGIYADNTTTAPLAPILQIKNSNIHQNNAGFSQSGGGANLSVTGLLFTGNTMSSNTAPPGRSGGGLSAELRGSNSTHTVSGNTITNNSAPNGSGGGMYVQTPGTSTTCTFSNNIVSNNTASVGGGIYIIEVGGNNNVVFAHNGMLFSHESPIPTESDTRFFARTVLAHRAADQIMGKPFQGFLAHLIGGGNKLAFLDATGDISIVNSEYGVWQEGVWYSNTGYLAPPVFDYSRGTHDSEHSYSDLDLLPEDDWVRHNRKSGNWPDDDRVVADWANTSGAF